eukprot:CAMPEP_0178991688 /NCGR_PEP_ID=MMETSP0795-20121207/5673_1 /TAXON_ID=88552 /ORGANISM="Amoebophrya sp., Strain Ameob2" /LENGTH=128 /DNA_ID=CAMNT_0020683437 /DNA_START=179 /DNA_END=565 /DNA_ORIENTATION=+
MDQRAQYQLESVQEAEEYLKKHRINELFNDLCAAVCYKKPENVKGFLVEELKKRQTAASLLFDDSEIEAVFRMADLMQTGTISASQCRQALCSIVNTESQYEMAQKLEFSDERVDLATFKSKVKQLFA